MKDVLSAIPLFNLLRQRTFCTIQYVLFFVILRKKYWFYFFLTEKLATASS